MQKIMEIVDRIGKLNLIIAGVIFAVLIIIYFVYRSMRLKKYRKIVLALEESVNSTKSLPIQYRLGRVKKIAKNDASLVDKYNSFLDRYKELEDYLVEKVTVGLNEIDEQLYFRRLKKANHRIQELNTIVETYQQNANELLQDIENITEIENVQRVAIIKVKESYREICHQFETVKYKIDEYVPLVGETLTTLEQEFSEMEEMMNHQMYAEAKIKCDKLEESVNFLSICIRDLPTYVSIARNYIPKRFNEISKKMEIMNEEGFCLERLNASKRFEKMNEDLTIVLEDIQTLKIQAVGENLEKITTEINDLIHDFELEENSHEEYLAIWKNIFNKISDIHEDYKYALTEYRKLDERYVLDDPKLDIAQSYPTLDRILEETKDLEHLIQSKDFSYSNVVETLKDLLRKGEGYETHLRYFFSKRDELYLTEQRAVDELDSINIVLLEIKSEIKNTNLPAISKEYKTYIEEAYQRSDRIQKLRNQLPINLYELTHQADEARDIIYKLYENVHNLVTTAQMVEETIMFGNRYRSSFLEVNTELTKAEILFRNGDYSEALKIAVAIVEKIQPGFNQQLLSKQLKSPTKA